MVCARVIDILPLGFDFPLLGFYIPMIDVPLLGFVAALIGLHCSQTVYCWHGYEKPAVDIPSVPFPAVLRLYCCEHAGVFNTVGILSLAFSPVEFVCMTAATLHTRLIPRARPSSSGARHANIRRTANAFCITYKEIKLGFYCTLLWLTIAQRRATAVITCQACSSCTSTVEQRVGRLLL